MSATASPFGIRPVYHPSGILRQEALNNGIASGYATALYTGSPVKFASNGTLVATATGADSACGVFQGVEYTSSSKFFILPYWPASQTYDNDGLMQVYFTSDPNIIYEGQADGTVAATANFETINLATTTGSTLTGLSTAALNHTTTGATAGTFQIIGLAPYTDNAWGDAFTTLRVKISTYAPAI